MRHHDIIPKV